MLTEKEVLHLLEETRAVLHGHFLLTSGLHSPMYVEKFNVLQNPAYTEKLCKEIAARYEEQYRKFSRIYPALKGVFPELR